MKDIKQLGFVSNIYPGATHTRFDHSIGTLYVTWQMLKRFVKNYKPKSQTVEDFPYEVVQAVRLAALLHDLGHGPYSHGIESVYQYLGMKFDHDELTCYLLTYDLPEDSTKSVANNILTVLGTSRINKLSRFRKEIGKIKKSMRELILGILNTKYKAIFPEPVGFSQLRYFLYDLLKGDIGSDRVDYLLRDTYFTGLGHRFSLSEILDNINAIYDPKRNRLLFAIHNEGRDALELMLLTRYFHYQFIAHNPKNISKIIGLIPRLKDYLLKMKKKESNTKTLIRVALETDWIERKLPSLQTSDFKELSRIKLSEIRHFALRYLLYRIMIDHAFKKVFLNEVETYLSNKLKNFSPSDIIFWFIAEKSHIPIIHVLFDKYVERKAKKSVLTHDHSPFLVNLGRAYIENSSLMIYARGKTYEETKVLMTREPHFYLKYSLVQKVMKQLDTKNLDDYDLLLLSLLRLTNNAKEPFKGVGNVIEIYESFKRTLEPEYRFLEKSIYYDPHWNENFPYPQNVFNDLVLFDACKLIRMEIIKNIPYKNYYKSSWQFTPNQLMIFSERLGREIPTKPINVLIRDFYPNKVLMFLKEF